MLFLWFSENGFDIREMFEYKGQSNFVRLKLYAYPFFVKQVFANFAFNVSENASSLVKGKIFDLNRMGGAGYLMLSPLRFFGLYWMTLHWMTSSSLRRVI